MLEMGCVYVCVIRVYVCMCYVYAYEGPVRLN